MGFRWQAAIQTLRARAQWPSRMSLRGRVALGVALPLMLALGLFALAQNEHERLLLEAQARHTATQLGNVLAGSLRPAMLIHDQEMLGILVRQLDAQDALDRLLLVDSQGIIQIDTSGAVTEGAGRVDDPGCAECHAYPAESRPRTVILRQGTAGTLRVATPIENEPACAGCHSPTQIHLGILLADVPLWIWQQQLAEKLRMDLALSGAGTLVLTLGVYALIHRLLVRRMERARAPLTALAAGDLGARLPRSGLNDEIDEIFRAVNTMADGLAQALEKQQARHHDRQRAIGHERERIARELHDGLSQLLGYVNTKAMAVRLLLQSGQAEQASLHLEQLEEAARGVSLDVRQAILDLKAASHGEGDLAAILRSLVDDSARLTGLPVELEADGLGGFHLPSEAEIHLIRIVQEALTNAWRHAQATRVEVRAQRENGSLVLQVHDNGRGFPKAGVAPLRPHHYGLAMMRERAEEIGADLEIHSSPGGGTTVEVRWKAPEE